MSIRALSLIAVLLLLLAAAAQAPASTAWADEETPVAAEAVASPPETPAGSADKVGDDANTAGEEDSAQPENEDKASEEEAEEDAWDGWDDAEGWDSGGFDYYGTATYWHSKDSTSGTDKNEGELAVSFSLRDYTGRFRVSNYHPFTNKTRDVRLEKYELNKPAGPFEFTFGTFSQMLGKGLVLSGIEQRDFDYDNEIEGFRVSYPGERFSALAFVGQHKKVTDPGATKVWGAHIETEPADWLTVGGNAFVYKQPIGGTTIGRAGYQAMSAETALKWRKFSAYAEYMRLDWPTADDGRGIYGNAVLSLPGFGLTYEYKDYWRINSDFTTPPPVRYGKEHAKVNLLDEKGYGFTMTWLPFGDDSVIEASYAQANARNKGWPTTEFIAAYHSPSTKNPSWMLQRLYHRDVLLHERSYHGECNYQWNDDFSTQLAVEVKGLDEGMGTRDEQAVSLDFAYGGWLTIVLTQERAERGAAARPQRWNLVEVKLQENGVQELSLAYGKRREGFVCSGGVCRTEPEFDGWKIEYLRFF